jgi:hypothetical protein
MFQTLLWVVFSLASTSFAQNNSSQPSQPLNNLDLSTFAGQAEAWSLAQQLAGASGNDEINLLTVAAAGDEDYSCTEDRPCKSGCCKLWVPP